MHIWLSLLCTPASLADHRFIRNSATLEQTQSYIRSSVLEGWSVPAPIGLYMQPISPYATMGSLLLPCVVFSVKLLVNPFILLKKKKKTHVLKCKGRLVVSGERNLWSKIWSLRPWGFPVAPFRESLLLISQGNTVSEISSVPRY